MKSNKWVMGWLLIVLILSTAIAGFVYYIDPFFHYHKPHTDKYYYELDNQRYQNDGIMRNFDYDALLTGTSMTENFKTTEIDRIFDVNSVKIPYSGAAYKEVNEGISRALNYNKDLKTVIRGIDMGYLFTDKDWMRDDLGTYPEYLYDDNPFNDVNYIFNQDVIFNRAYKMVLDSIDPEHKPGILSFDNYSSWQNQATMGVEKVCPKGIEVKKGSSPVYITDEEQILLKENIRQNITELAADHPDVDFYCFFTPYSMVWWNEINNEGNIYRYVEAEKCAIEEMLQYKNIKLFSYNTRIDITSDLNNYKDPTHYGSWVSTLILYWMHEGEGRITRDNYDDYINEELSVHLDYDYASLIDQEDAEDDMEYGEAVFSRELSRLLN